MRRICGIEDRQIQICRPGMNRKERIAMQKRSLELTCVSSLAKIFPDTDPEPYACSSGTALQGEFFSFQVVYRAGRLIKRLHAEADMGKLSVKPLIRRVGLVPSEMPTYGDADDFMLRTEPGLYPDPLFPLTAEDEIYAYPGQWRALWITIPVGKDTAPGTYPIRVRIRGTDDSTFGDHLAWYGELLFTLSILPAALPAQQILHTEWFSADCIGTWYGLTPFAPQWWKMMDAYIRNAAEHGVNLLLTPVFTPPLETKIGAERPTVQLVGITKAGDVYGFDFTNLEKWVDMCLAHGINCFEMPHLFTQWGAKFTPKIIVQENDEYKKLFG